MSIIFMLPCESGGTGRRARLRGVWFTPYGFKSRFSHQTQRGRTVWCALFVFGARFDCIEAAAATLALSFMLYATRQERMPFLLAK